MNQVFAIAGTETYTPDSLSISAHLHSCSLVIRSLLFDLMKFGITTRTEEHILDSKLCLKSNEVQIGSLLIGAVVSEVQGALRGNPICNIR